MGDFADGDREARAALDDWARSLAGMSGIERDLHVAQKITALAGIVDDPTAECEAALKRVAGNGSRPARPPEASAPAGEDPPKALQAVTVAQLLTGTPERPDYLWGGYIARGAVTELAAKPKAGKTRFALELVARLLQGEAFLGHATFTTPVLYLTEESRQSFAGAVRRAAIAADAPLEVLLHGAARGLKWDELGDLVLEHVQAHKVGLVVVDTLSAWAGLRGEDENSAGAALTAVAPLRALADAGCGVLTTRHERKGPGEIGESARGSSAFGGAADVLLRLVRSKGRGHETRRVLEAVGRFDETPPTVTIDLDRGRYVVVAEGADAARRQAELELLEALASCDCEELGLTEAELCDVTGMGHSTAGRALHGLLSRDVIARASHARPDGRGAVTVYWHAGAL